jgi:FkbM family methyltransferase
MGLAEEFLKLKQDEAFKNFKEVYNYFEPKSYLDIGACKGWAIPFVKTQLYTLERMEMIEANRAHEAELRIISQELNIPYRIEVLSDTVKEVTFYLDGVGNESAGPGNSYYKEDTRHYVDTPKENRITNTLDNIYSDEDSFDIIKMDTQGSELDIIKGGLNLISRTKALILEENVVPFNIGAPLHDEVRTYVESLGFTLVHVLEDKKSTIQNSNGESIEHHEIDTLYIRNEYIKK